MINYTLRKITHHFIHGINIKCGFENNCNLYVSKEYANSIGTGSSPRLVSDCRLGKGLKGGVVLNILGSLDSIWCNILGKFEGVLLQCFDIFKRGNK